MKSNSLSELKKELQLIPPAELLELCIALAKYKKDNKEYLTYLLFESTNKQAFINEVKAEIEEHINALKSQPNLYYVKKGLRKLLRTLGKYSKYVNDKALSAEVLIYFCSQLKQSGIPYPKSPLLVNMYGQQLKKINTLVSTLHEDLQQDYLNDLEKISA
jgi:membrane-anchored protein YejM (alkaline phosphatase superfamily)